MLTIQNCRRLLRGKMRRLTNKEIEKVRDTLYALAELALDEEIHNDKIKKKEEN